MSRHLLKCKLKIAGLETELRELRAALFEQNRLLHECNKMLAKFHPSRQHLTSDQKMLIAAKARFRCANTVDGNCPLYKIPPKDGVFDSCFEIDHVTPRCKAPIGRLQVLCCRCLGFPCTQVERLTFSSTLSSYGVHRP